MLPAAGSQARSAVTWHKPLILLVTLALALAVYLALPVEHVGELGRRTAAIFVIAAIFWATELIPLYATSLCVVGLQVLLLAADGGLAPQGALDFLGRGDLNYTQFLAPFGSNIIMLFLGGLILSAAVTKTGLDQALASRFLQPAAHRPILLLFTVLGLSAVFSMWMSNTATAAMMLAVTAPMLRRLPESSRFQQALILAVPFGANIGGIGTPIGTPPNAIAMGALRDAGFEITFLDWMIIAVPLALIMLVVTGLLLYWLYPPEPDLALAAAPPAAPITGAGWYTLAVLLAAIAAWLTGAMHSVSDGMVALLAGAALVAGGTLSRRDVNSLEWTVLILMWGGLALGGSMELTGLINPLKSMPFAELNPVLLTGLIMLLTIFVGTFMSNTAAAALLVPIVLALAIVERGQLVVIAALGCSFAMAMPVSTPPNALAFATGRVSVKAMVLIGTLIGVIAIVVMMAGYKIMLPIAIPEMAVPLVP